MLFRSPDLDFLNIVDTQVKYGQEYKYRIYAYQFVLGNKYSQSAPALGYSPSYQFFLRISQQADIKILETEIISLTRKIIDSPPLPPDVEFVPYQGMDNKIGIFLNNRTGQETVETINVLNSDLNITNKYNKNLNGKVLYKSDDKIGRAHV